jgi:predicted oxidoreductase (fatty acid repression mutant protein)
MSPADPLISLAQSRRTIYALGKTPPSSASDAQLTSLLHNAIRHIPSSFNTQSTRLILLLHAEHDKLWDIAIEAFGAGVRDGSIPVDTETWTARTLPKLRGLRGATGTVLFYEDPAHIEPFVQKFPVYKDHFGAWAEQSNAMHQYFRTSAYFGTKACLCANLMAVWTGLEALGFGANLQHYNPLIDARVAEQWDVPRDWRLVAQLVFGSPEGEPKEKTQKPVEERVKIYGMNS